MLIFKRVHMYFMLVLFCLGLFTSSSSFAQHKPYDKVVVFGTSLSDPGNAFVVLSNPSSFGFDESCNPLTPLNVPPYDSLDEFYVPDGVYAIGGHHDSNGATWIEQLARQMKLAGFTRPALRNDGQQALNFATGGARANYYPCRFNLSDQLAAFSSSSTVLAANSLVVIEMGGNDLRDALVVWPAGSSAIIGSAISNIGIAIEELYSIGARHFLLMNVPDIGKTPAVQILNGIYPGLATVATGLTTTFNGYLAGLEGQLKSEHADIDIRIFDAYTLLNSIMANPGDYGMEVVDEPCVTPNVAPYKCSNPDTYLFWDGIHPTKAVHKIMADTAVQVLATP